jgi:hypothetical protein
VPAFINGYTYVLNWINEFPLFNRVRTYLFILENIPYLNFRKVFENATKFEKISHFFKLSKQSWRLFQVFVVFSEHLNFIASAFSTIRERWHYCYQYSVMTSTFFNMICNFGYNIMMVNVNAAINVTACTTSYSI